MFVNQWQTLRRPMPAAIGINKTNQLVMALARLHNFCINERVGIDPSLATDAVEVSAHGGIPLLRRDWNDNSPEQLLRGGHHFHDVNPKEPRQIEARARRALGGVLPRDLLMQAVIDKDLKRPAPAKWK